MTESKMLELAQELQEQSKSGKVEWEQILRSNSYEVSFPDISLQIHRFSGADYSLRLLSHDQAHF